MNLTVCTTTNWGGLIGGWYYNMGSLSNPYSYFLRDYNLTVNIIQYSDRTGAFDGTEPQHCDLYTY